MKILISPSENYSREDVERLLADLQQTGIEIEFGGYYGRRSIEALPPELLIIVSGIAGGILESIGSDIWDLIKRVIQRVAKSTLRGDSPGLRIVIESDSGDSVLWNFPNDGNLNELLDQALAQLQELGKPNDLWYVENLNAWLTLDEVLAYRIRSPNQTNDQSQTLER